jgi:hypothetical protein
MSPAQRPPGEPAARRPVLRVDADAEDIGRGLGRLVIAVLEILRQLLERQALRRVDAGNLSDEQVERLGEALLALQEKFAELRDVFDLRTEDLSVPVEVEKLASDVAVENVEVKNVEVKNVEVKKT